MQSSDQDREQLLATIATLHEQLNSKRRGSLTLSMVLDDPEERLRLANEAAAFHRSQVEELQAALQNAAKCTKCRKLSALFSGRKKSDGPPPGDAEESG